MKGTLHKCKVEGWLVLYTVEETWDKCIPIHPDYEKYYFLDDDADGTEVEFEIVLCNYSKDKQDFYAKLIRPSVDKLGNDECCTPEGKIKRYVDCKGCDRKPNKVGNDGFMFDAGSTYPPDVDKLGNEDVPKLGYDVDKLAKESWEGCDGCTKTDEIMYLKAYARGYNAAIADSYTEEDMNNYAEYCTTHVLTAQVGHPYLSVKEWSKLPKKG